MNESKFHGQILVVLYMWVIDPNGTKSSKWHSPIGTKRVKKCFFKADFLIK
jgi:hypothetical protein